MGHIMQFYTTDIQPISLPEVAAHLGQLGPRYTLELEDTHGLLQHDGVPIACLAVNVQGDDSFEEDRIQLVLCIETARDPVNPGVVDVLKRSTGVLIAHVLLAGRDPQTARRLLQLLWTLLFRRAPGLLRIEDEGYFDAQGMVLSER
jgi:hypothetical protein